MAEALKSAEDAENGRIATVARLVPSVIAIFPPDGSGGGSGVVISEDGLALTNFHVVQPCGYWMKVGTSDGNICDAVLVGIDPVGDIALIQVLKKPSQVLSPATLGDSDRLRQGDDVWVLGNPFGYATDFAPSVSRGVVSGVHRYQFPAGTLLEYADCIQVDAPVNPGNSGGPLFNADGELVGINGRCSFEKRGRINVGVGYAVSINQIRLFLSHLRSGRVVDHATVGATVAADSIGSPYWNEILEDCELALLGVEPLDRLLAFAGRRPATPNDFKNVLGIYPRGWVVPVVVARKSGAKYEEQRLCVRLTGVHSEGELSKMIETGIEDPERRPDAPKPPEPPKPLEDGIPEEMRKMRELFKFLEKAPKEVEALYEKRAGFANYHFNRRETLRVLDAVRENAALPPVLAGVTASGAPFELDFRERMTLMKLPTTEVIWENEGDYTRPPIPAESQLILPILTFWHKFTLDPDSFRARLGYWGESPLREECGADTPEGAATGYDLLYGNVGGLDVLISVATGAGDGAGPGTRVRAIEVAAPDGGLPWEFRFSDFRPADGKSYATKIAVLRGPKALETLTFAQPPDPENPEDPQNPPNGLETDAL